MVIRNTTEEEVLTSESAEATAPQEEVTVPAPKREAMVPLSEVKKLIAEAMASQGEVMAPERAVEHTASLCRLDSKWVIGFKDHNTDPYLTTKVESIKRWNAEGKEWVSYVTVMFNDGSEKEMPLNLFMRHATPINCRIVERKREDKSYSIGKTEKVEWKGDRKISTGVMVDQKVKLFEDTFVIQTPDGLTVEVPPSVINLIQAPNTKK